MEWNHAALTQGSQPPGHVMNLVTSTHKAVLTSEQKHRMYWIQSSDEVQNIFLFYFNCNNILWNPRFTFTTYPFGTILYFVDCASCYKLLLITNLTHFFMYVFISSLYTFQVSQCSSSDRIVLIHHLVWLGCVSDCLVCRPSWLAYQAVTYTD